MAKTLFLDHYQLFYEVAYTDKECIELTEVRVTKRQLGQLLRRYA